MASRAIFKAVIQVDELEVPVKLYSAIREERVRFHLLHEEDETRLEQEMFCRSEEEPVEQEDRVRGYEISRGQYVILEPEEIKEARPKTDRSMEVLHFVDEEEIDPRLYHRAYYLGPDGQKNRYALLARALRHTGRVAICRWAMRGKSYLGFVKALEKLLLLTTLRFHHQIVPVESLELEEPEVKDKELKMARNLIDELTAEFDPSRYRNEHQQALLDLIEKKAKGEEPEKKKPKRKKPTRPSELHEKLAASLEEARAG